MRRREFITLLGGAAATASCRGYSAQFAHRSQLARCLDFWNPAPRLASDRATFCSSVARMSMRAARDLILVICAVISTACLVWLLYLALNLDISVVDSIGGR
jgi:hypothetical protein